MNMKEIEKKFGKEEYLGQYAETMSEVESITTEKQREEMSDGVKLALGEILLNIKSDAKEHEERVDYISDDLAALAKKFREHRHDVSTMYSGGPE